MNELRRQRYLTSMSIDSYIPRLLLPKAPKPFLCELPEGEVFSIAQANENVTAKSQNPFSKKDVVAQSVQDIFDTIGLKNKAVTSSVATENNIVKKPIESHEIVNIEPFVLTVWRPREDFLIIDACKKGAALPTHLLLQNILKILMNENILIGAGDRVQFPLISNIHGGNTVEHMSNSLQTWLSAEYEKRPSPNVWLMGGNAVQYILSDQAGYESVVWKNQTFEMPNNNSKPLLFSAKILPSLSDFLLTPKLKAKLWDFL